MSKLWWILLAFVLLCACIALEILVVIDHLDPESASTKLLVDITKTFVQLAVIGILGGLVKWAFDQYTRERDRAAEINEFRKEMLRRLIAVNAEIRQAPVLMEAARSAQAYGEQMQVLIGAWLELSFIRHEIETAGEQAFAHWQAISKRFVRMERWFEPLTREYRKEYNHLADMPPEMAWSHIRDLPELKQLLSGHHGSPYRHAYVDNYFGIRDMLRQEIWAAVGVETGRQEEGA
jgi:hypothetical protein